MTKENNFEPMKWLYFSLGLIGIALQTFSQESPSVNIGGGFHYGFLAYHNSTMRGMQQRHIKAGELEFSVVGKGQSNWHRFYKNPHIGLSIMAMDLGSPDYLGAGVSLFPFIRFPLLGGDNYKLVIRTGAGLGYVQKIFDAAINNKANAIGSHLNGFVNLRLSSYIRLYKPLVLELGLGLSHFSNGGSKAPNKGINMPTINTSLIYEMGISNQVKADTSKYIYKKHRFFCILSGGASQLTRIGDKTYAVGTGQFFYDYHATIKSSFGAGVDLMYNGVYPARLKYDSIPISSNFENIQVGLKVLYQFNMHRLILPIEFGVYGFSAYKKNGLLYHRIGVRYLVTKHLTLNVSLKTHFAVAEYFECGLGWCF